MYAGATTKDTLYQKRYLSTGALDVYVETPFNPGFGGYGDGTSYISWSLGSDDDEVQSIVNDGTYFYAFLSYRVTFDLPWPYNLKGGFDYWGFEKRDVSSGTLLIANMYLYGIYGPVPNSPSVQDFGPHQLWIDGNRIFAAGPNSSSQPYLVPPTESDLLWRIEKRKISTFAFDSLFNTEGAQPGSIEFNPSFGVPGIPERWTETWGVDGDPGPAYGDIYYDPGSGEYYHYTYKVGIADIYGLPDRAWAITEAGGKIFIVGADRTDLPSKLGQWRMECRNK